MVSVVSSRQVTVKASIFPFVVTLPYKVAITKYSVVLERVPRSGVPELVPNFAERAWN